jgi:hypothetical protein
MNQTTKITSRSVRATVSDKFCSFAFESVLEDVNGVSESDADEAQDRCTLMAAMALDKFMKGLAIELGIDKKLPKNFDNRTVQQIVEDYKSTIGVKDNASADEVMDKPLFQPNVKPGKPIKK